MEEEIYSRVHIIYATTLVVSLRNIRVSGIESHFKHTYGQDGVEEIGGDTLDLPCPVTIKHSEGTGSLRMRILDIVKDGVLYVVFLPEGRKQDGGRVLKSSRTVVSHSR